MKVQWTKFALSSLYEIFKFYKTNVSVTIAVNIKNSILTSTRQLETHPLSGAKEELLEDLEEDHRSLVRGNYKIIYKIQNSKVIITDIFDSRQSPDKIKRSKK